VCCSYNDVWTVYLSETVVVICSYECTCSVNTVTNLNLAYSHTQSRDNTHQITDVGQ
jgi:ethanolamine ammonia-lyase small subunit